MNKWRCKKCDGIGIVPVSTGGYAPCKCLVEDLIIRKLGEKLAQARLSTIKARTPSQEHALKKIIDAPRKSWYICGDNRSGKTYMIAALYNFFMVDCYPERGTFWVNASTMRKAFSGVGSISFETEDIYEGKVKRLFIDDLGKETISDWCRQEYHELFTALCRTQAQVVITSNFPPEKLVGDEHQAFLGMGTVSRIIDIMGDEYIELTGKAMDCCHRAN